MGEEDGFHAWLQAISPESFHEGAFIPNAWLRWLRLVFDQEGPLSRDAVERRANKEIRAAAEGALRRVLDDLERVQGRRPRIELHDHDGLRVAHPEEGRIATEPPEGLVTPSELGAVLTVTTAVLDLLADVKPEAPLVCQHHRRDRALAATR